MKQFRDPAGDSWTTECKQISRNFLRPIFACSKHHGVKLRILTAFVPFLIDESQVKGTKGHIIVAISCLTSSAFLVIILDKVNRDFTLILLFATEMSCWKLSPYWWKGVQVSAMWASWNLLSKSLSISEGFLKKSSFAFLGAGPASPPWAGRFVFLDSSNSLFFFSNSFYFSLWLKFRCYVFTIILWCWIIYLLLLCLKYRMSLKKVLFPTLMFHSR